MIKCYIGQSVTPYLPTLGTKMIVLISEVSLFQGENSMYSYKQERIRMDD